MLYTPQQLQNLGSIIAKPKFLWDGIIPEASKVVLLHGPGGVGKSALLWNLLNHIEDGTPFLGIATMQSPTLLISTDMSIHEIYLRWDTNFKAQFHMEVVQPFEIRHPNFYKTDVHNRVKQFVQDKGVKLVAVDTIGKIHFGDANSEETVAQVYGALTRWLPDVTWLGNFHNKKPIRDATGREIITEDDFRGSRKWVDDAVVQLHMRKVPKSTFHSKLYHSKSQVGPLIDPLDCYIDSSGNVDVWQDNKAKKVVQQWGDVMQSLPNGTQDDLIKEYMNRHGCSRATAYRARAQYWAVQGKAPP